MATLQKNRTTPGIYITEIPAFGNSVVGVPTAVPIFIGYTEWASDPATGKPLYNQAVPLTSMTDYANYFGADFATRYIVTPASSNSQPPASGYAPAASGSNQTAAAVAYDFQAPAWNPSTAAGASQPLPRTFVVQADMLGDPVTAQFNLYTAMMLFFANGGGQCFVVSVSDYWGGQSTGPQPFPPPASLQPTTVDPTLLQAGLNVANATYGPTMIVVPALCMLPPASDGTYPGPGYTNVVQQMLVQAGTLGDRVAIIDLPGVLNSTTWQSTDNDAFTAQVNALSSVVGAEQAYASYGVAYGPAIETTILGMNDVDYQSLSGTQSSINLLNNMLTIQASGIYASGTSQLAQIMNYIGQAFPVSNAGGMSPISTATSPAPTTETGAQTLTNHLVNALPLMNQILQVLLTKLNAAPPSGAIAGIWSANDVNRGVWNAPANMTLASVSQPKVHITDQQQGPYNVPLDGYSVCILRALPNRGVVVWGARTLDGNSNDYRYIQVRRTLIYVEQSIKQALQPFVFAANDATTWLSVTAMISNFLTNLWQAGGLTGSKASEAFSVSCGLSSTMTAQDILNGYMIVSVSLAMVHPAEFIELTFTQMMQGA